MLTSVKKHYFFEEYSQENTASANLSIFSEKLLVYTIRIQQELEDIKKNCKEADSDSIQIFLYKTLSVFGGIYAFFAGFDGMLSVLSILFPELSISLMMSLGLVASFSALGVFLARDRMAIAEALEISEEPEVDIINDYLFSLEKYYAHLFNQSFENPKDLEIFAHIKDLELLKEFFISKSEINNKIILQSSSYFQAQSLIGIGAILFFSDGFFIGQGLVAILAQFLMVNSAPLILSLSIFLGLMALSAYWFVERPYVEKYLYQELLTDESKVQECLQRLDKELKVLKKFEQISAQTTPLKSA